MDACPTPPDAPDRDAPRWAALRARAPDAAFVYGVTSTGIYCRPDCPARRPRPENVRFFDDASAARTAGFRPCRRCQPDTVRGDALIAAACRRLAVADPPSLPALIASLGLGRRQFFARFKAATGLTPAAFSRHARAERARQGLAAGAPVTATVHEAGFGSAARFYAAWRRDTADPPGAYRRGGAGLTIVYGVAPCALGEVLAAATPRGLCAVLLGSDPATLRADLAARFPQAVLRSEPETFAATLRAVVAAIEAPATRCALPLDIQGTLFQQKVWAALREIPPGTTLSYAELAARCGVPRGARAVAAACAANPLAVIVPCHRVVARDGQLAGYRWGVDRKRALLTRESS